MTSNEDIVDKVRAVVGDDILDMSREDYREKRKTIEGLPSEKELSRVFGSFSGFKGFVNGEPKSSRVSKQPSKKLIFPEEKPAADPYTPEELGFLKLLDQYKSQNVERALTMTTIFRIAKKYLAGELRP